MTFTKFKQYQSFTVFLFFILLPCTLELSAQTNITIINPSFEKPDSGKVKGWDGECADAGWAGQLEDIPGWVSDSTAFDSGVEEAADATDGKYRGFLMGGDEAVYQIPGKRIYNGDIITLTVDALNTWAATLLRMELFYLLEDNTKVTIVSEDKTLTDSFAEYSISFSAADHPDCIGYRIGVSFDNISSDESWVGIDNVRLTNSDPRIIDVDNYSFELPDVGKIKGWDGVCSNAAYTGPFDDIPGWESDDYAYDSGVELGYTPTDGLYTAFMMGNDAPVYQITNYTIQATDAIELLIDARITWAASLIGLELFYTDASDNHVVLASDQITITDTYYEYSIGFNASGFPDAVGRPLGISISNPSPTGESWIGFDNVRLLNGSFTGVETNDGIPATFNLSQNYPNPFNPTTQITYSLAEEGKVKLSVFDILGNEVAVIVNKTQNAGTFTVSYNADKLASGLYLYRLEAGDHVFAKKMILLK
ncbi:MAG: T9SS type A sorting domain-containing protein [bacterium]